MMPNYQIFIPAPVNGLTHSLSVIPLVSVPVFPGLLELLEHWLEVITPPLLLLDERLQLRALVFIIVQAHLHLTQHAGLCTVK